MNDAPSRIPRQIVRPGEHRRALRFDLNPNQVGRDAVAAELGIPGVRELRFSGRLEPEGRTDWRLEAELAAEVVQDCVVTLEPVVTRIHETLDRRYEAAPAEPEPLEAEVPEEDVEPLPATLDLGEVMLEALALAIPAYPRAEGVELGEVVATEPGAEPLTEEKAKPFAGLGDALRRRD